MNDLEFFIPKLTPNFIKNFVKTRKTSLSTFGAFGALFAIYLVDFRPIVGYIPFYNIKFRNEPEE